MNKLWARFEYVLKHNIVINRFFLFVASMIVRILGLFIKMDEKAILFSALSKNYTDSPRVIYEYLIAHPEFENYKFYWAIKEDIQTIIPGKYLIVKPDTIRYFITALKCKYWVTCVNIERNLKFKKKKCRYLNTWHGIPIKTVGNQAVGRKDYNYSHIDFFCISGDYEAKVYNNAFKINEKQLLKVGMPRNDSLYESTPEEVYSIKKKMMLPLDKKIILYAPTWRDSRDGGQSYSIKPPINIMKWKALLHKDYILLLRTHPYTNSLLGIDFDDFVINCANYPSINDLLKISDLLISDYSATIFDFSILKKPIICFAYDLDEYIKERGFSLDVRNEMPGGVCYNEDEVIGRVLKSDYTKDLEAVNAFNKKYVQYGGNATKNCVERLFEK